MNYPPIEDPNQINKIVDLGPVMGISYSAIFFYGVCFEGSVFSSLLEKMENEVFAEIPPEFRVYDGTSGLIAEINWDWEKSGDPLRLCHQWHGFSCLYVGESFHEVNESGCSRKSFQLSIMDTSRWDRLLRRKCEELEFPWAPPGFIFEVVENHASLFYGVSFRGASSIWYSKVPEKLNIDTHAYKSFTPHPNEVIDMVNDRLERPFFMETENVEEGIPDEYALGLWDTIEHEGAFELEGADTTTWNQLLQAKCERYGIWGGIPSFHIHIVDG